MDIIKTAVKTNGLALEYVEEQTPEICLEKEQTSELCFEAVRQDAKAVKFIKNLTPDLKMKLYEMNPAVIEYLQF